MDGCRAALARGLGCGVPRYMHQTLLLLLCSTGFLSQLLSAQKKFSRRPWIDLLSFPIIHIPQGSLTTFAVPKQSHTLPPTGTKGTLCSLRVPRRNIIFLFVATNCIVTSLPQDSLRRRVILSSHRAPAPTPSVQLPQH